MSNSISITIPTGWADRADKRAFAMERGLGLEIGAFLGAAARDDMAVRRKMEHAFRHELDGFPYPVSYHGSFLDLALHSADEGIASLSRRRIVADLQTASRLGCEKVVFHTGFNPLIPQRYFWGHFLEAQRSFWGTVADQFPNVTICLENQWEPTPEIFLSLLQAIDHPNVQMCLDVAHAHVYSSQVSAAGWVERLYPHIRHLHLNDNHGDEDTHLGIGEGSVDWPEVVAGLEVFGETLPSLVIELKSLAAITRSLDILDGLGLYPEDPWSPLASSQFA